MVSGNQKYLLPLDADYFFEINKFMYIILYLHQASFMYLIGAWTVGNDGLFFAFLVRLHLQLKLLQYRIERIPENVNIYLNENKGESKLNAERKIFAKVIQQHQMIFEYVLIIKSKK